MEWATQVFKVCNLHGVLMGGFLSGGPVRADVKDRISCNGSIWFVADHVMHQRHAPDDFKLKMKGLCRVRCDLQVSMASVLRSQPLFRRNWSWVDVDNGKTVFSINRVYFF